MNSFKSGRIGTPLDGKLLAQLTAVYEYKGKQALYETQAPEVLTALRAAAIIESTESSNRIEGIVATPARVREIVAGGADPVTRPESEIAGYRDVLSTIHASFPDIPITPNAILQLHRDLYRFTAERSGQWKPVDNTIEATLPGGANEIIFRPVAAAATAGAMTELCDDFRDASARASADRLLLTAAFALDFLCIHPFLDGNGRMARLLTTLLLYQAGFSVARYVSLERVIEETKSTYYASLRASSEDWHAGAHTLTPWWEYFLGVTLAAYRELEQRLALTRVPSKADRVALAVAQLPARFTIAELARACPGVSRVTMKRALGRLRDAGEIRCVRGGKYALWEKVTDGSAPSS